MCVCVCVCVCVCIYLPYQAKTRAKEAQKLRQLLQDSMHEEAEAKTDVWTLR